jgi:hypothetical protein
VGPGCSCQRGLLEGYCFIGGLAGGADVRRRKDGHSGTRTHDGPVMRLLDNVHPARRSSKGDFCSKHIKSVRSVRKPLPECGFGGGAGGYCRPERTAKIRNEFVDPQ